MYPRKRRQPWTWLEHCDLWAVTRDENWVFLNPSRHGCELSVVHKAEEVDALWAVRMAIAARIYRYEAARIPRSVMPIAPLSCASVCAHVLGFRAWTPRSLERKLIANGAVLIWEAEDGRAEGRPPVEA